MKQYSRLLPLVAFSMAFQSTLASSPELPKVEILGKEYYYHARYENRDTTLLPHRKGDDGHQG